MLGCRIHGFAPTCNYSQDLLELQADGTLPGIVVVEVKDTREEEAFFRFNVSPAVAATLTIVDGRIPFDFNAAEIMDGLETMCGFCFGERRETLKAQQARGA